MKRTKNNKSKIIQFRIPPTEAAQLRSVIEKHQFLSLSEFIRSAIREKLHKNEIHYD